METFNIDELKAAYYENLKNTWNNGKTKSDVDEAKKIFYERYGVYGFYMRNYEEEEVIFYYSSKKPYMNKYNQLCFDSEEEDLS